MVYLIRDCTAGGNFSPFSSGNPLNKLFPNNVVNGRCVSIFFESATSQNVNCRGIVFAEGADVCTGGTFTITNRDCNAKVVECPPFN
ncbi:MAG: hypothetical protein FWG64_03440 [Firmicutes bacterium]|nr:hypothetical protein [Bacillota bacterium]